VKFLEDQPAKVSENLPQSNSIAAKKHTKIKKCEHGEIKD
jgi:hypothetical protein